MNFSGQRSPATPNAKADCAKIRTSRFFILRNVHSWGSDEEIRNYRRPADHVTKVTVRSGDVATFHPSLIFNRIVFIPRRSARKLPTGTSALLAPVVRVLSDSLTLTYPNNGSFYPLYLPVLHLPRGFHGLRSH